MTGVGQDVSKSERNCVPVKNVHLSVNAELLKVSVDARHVLFE